MSSRSSHKGRSSGRRRAAPVAAAAGRGLAGIARIVLLAIMAAAVVQSVLILIEQPASLGPGGTASSYVASALAVVAVAVMLALALNTSFLPGFIGSARRQGLLFAFVPLAGIVAIVVGLLQSRQLGTVVAVDVLLGGVPFVLMGLVTPGLYRRPGEGTAAGDAAGDRGGPRERARQRRGGRTGR
jgi:hypothetical protein